MLKRLELIGFKSFADKTQFDFPAGITGIVGPNGSGKSNVVDAVRWVLGEQSAKSLRGGEMTDVIFNGSASRRSLGLAEVTLTFDNSKRVLATESGEVQITRRVYRSSEGEYLINGQLCRLKDIKDLFLGSGAGTDAYSIIEQGRVDVLLQASTRDRRTIFEEAAGISRFKAKKLETLRRLERADQNVQRLRDILDEVEKQLRSVKLQAAKAQRHQEYTARLRELRVGLSLREYHEIIRVLQRETTALEEMQAALKEQLTRAEGWERQLHEMEQALARFDEAIRTQEADRNGARQQIATEQARQSHGWSQSADLEQDLEQTRKQLAEVDRQLAGLGQAAAAAAAAVDAASEQCTAQQQAAQAQLQALRSTEARLATLQQESQRDKEAHFEAMHKAGKLQNEVVSCKAQVDNVTRARERLRMKTEQAAAGLASLDVELQELTAADEDLQGQLAAARQALGELRQERDRQRGLQDETNQQLGDLRNHRSGLASRIEVLEGLERSHEGLGTGAREVLALLEQPDPGPWRTVIGIVADYLTVRREYAPLIDLALGERSQRFLVQDAEQLAQALRQRGQPFSSRVSFLPVGEATPPPTPPRNGEGSQATDSLAPLPASGRGWGRGSSPQGELPNQPGVVALAEQVARCEDPQLAGLPHRLLGNTLIVRDLAVARAIAAAHPGSRCITLQGELLDADGTLTVGQHHAETGILSRKSELRELREQVLVLDQRLADLEGDLQQVRQRLLVLDDQIEQQQLEIDVLNERTADMRSRLGQARQRRDGLQEEVQLSQSEITQLERDIGKYSAALQTAREQAAQAEARAQEMHARTQAADRESRQREEQRRQQQQQVTSARVALAQTEERLAGLRQKKEQLDQDLLQRQRDREQRQSHLNQTRTRIEENQQTLLAISSILALAYLHKEQAERQLTGLNQQRERTQTERHQLLEQTKNVRSAFRIQQEQVHNRELEVNDLRNKREALCSRLQEDYQLDLAALYSEQLATLPDAAAVEQALNLLLTPRHSGEEEGDGPPPQDPVDEITELRRKLSRLGSVNLEAIDELKDLEARASHLQLQYDDLASGQQKLQEIIDNHQQRQPTAVRRHVPDDPGAFPGAVPQAVRRRPGRRHPGGRHRHPGVRHRGDRPAARQGAAQHLADVRRRKDHDGGGPAAGDLPQPAEPVLHPRRGGRRPGRGQRRPLHQRAARLPRPLAVHHHHPLQTDHAVRRRSVRRHHAGVGRVPAHLNPLRGLEGRDDQRAGGVAAADQCSRRGGDHRHTANGARGWRCGFVDGSSMFTGTSDAEKATPPTRQHHTGSRTAYNWHIVQPGGSFLPEEFGGHSGSAGTQPGLGSAMM